MQDVMLTPYLLISALASSPEGIAAISEAEIRAAQLPQAEIATQHVLHAGLYARTIMIPAGVAITGALVEVATVLIVSGDCTVSRGDSAERLTGYAVLPASAHRKQAFFAHADTYLTMIFATSAKSVGEAEDEFTSEAAKLMSRQPGHSNTIVVTGK
jgi:hypothetical protein